MAERCGRWARLERLGALVRLVSLFHSGLRPRFAARRGCGFSEGGNPAGGRGNEADVE